MADRLDQPLAGYCPHGVMVAATVSVEDVSEFLAGCTQVATASAEHVREQLSPCDVCDQEASRG